MAKKIKTKKTKSVLLSPSQLIHIIDGTVRNLVDLKFNISEDGIKFLLILDCLNPEDCMPVDQDPETEQELFDILCSHAVPELGEFFEVVLPVQNEDGKYYRGFSTIDINENNMGDFIQCLSELEDYWVEIDQQIEDDEDLKNKTKGKNFVQGNNTVN